MTILARCKKDVPYFVEKMMGVKPTFQQKEILDMYLIHSRLVIVSGHGIGKSSALSWLIIHALLFTKEITVPCSAPTSAAIRDILFREVRKWVEKMPIYLKKQIEVTTKYIRWVDETGNPSANRTVLPKTAKVGQAQALAGMHSDVVLTLIDEASAVEPAIFEVLEGTLTGKNSRIILIGNPTVRAGYFYEASRDKTGLWKKLHFSSEDSPNVDMKWIREMEDKYGRESNIFKVRVLGEFPASGENTFMNAINLDSAYDREQEVHEGFQGKKLAGFDPARFGNDASALVIRSGFSIDYITQWRNKDLMESVGLIKQAYLEQAFEVIFIDVVGLGAGVYDRLKEIGIPCVAVNVSESTSSKEKYVRLRDELWDLGKIAFDEKRMSVNNKSISRKKFSELADELGVVRYDYQNGKLKIESKADLKKRGVQSPNLADAFLMTFANDLGISSVVQKAKAIPLHRGNGRGHILG